MGGGSRGGEGRRDRPTGEVGGMHLVLPQASSHTHTGSAGVGAVGGLWLGHLCL